MAKNNNCKLSKKHGIIGKCRLLPIKVICIPARNGRRGPQGIQGPAGLQGQKGARGTQGLTGLVHRVGGEFAVHKDLQVRKV